jgi:sugar O-acyltransferase (sialic acid O-acetyltransferase NeuD family)
VPDKKIILAGYSGHGFVVAEAALLSGLDLQHYADMREAVLNPFNLEYLGYEGDVAFEGWEDDCNFILGIGDNTLRQKIAQLILSKNRKLANVIHPSASVSQHITIGTGNFIARNAAVNPMAVIGNYCILNTGCIIEHECVLHDSVHVAPGAVLAGNVTVGERSFIGANTVIKQGIKIGKDVVIGAGSVIIKNIPDGKKVAGNPSREI